MGKIKKHNWRNYFYSRMAGNYSETHKNILNLLNERLKHEYPENYPDIPFNWSDISVLYDECRDEYYRTEISESKRMLNESTTDIIHSYPIDVHINRMSNFVYSPFRFSSIEIEMIQWNKEKDCVFVKLMDGRSTVVKRYGDTKDDIYAAVAYAIAKIEFETNSNFKKEVNEHLVVLESKKGKKNGK
nr:MAG TPA: hypothetical protein [Caudoviricetes sp.]